MREAPLLAWTSPGFVNVEQGVQRALSTAGRQNGPGSDISYVLGVEV
jgi:hypothetical protein